MPTITEATQDSVTIDGRVYRVGDTADEFALANLPAGTVVWGTDGMRWHKMRHGERSSWSSSRDPGDTTRLDPGYCTIESLPPPTPKARTLAEYQRQFVSHALAGARSRRINMEPVMEVLREMGIDDLTEQPTVGSHVGSTTQAPDGTIACYRKMGDMGFTVYERKAGQWVRTYGDYTMEQLGDRLIVEHSPAPPVVDDDADEDEAERIAEFKSTAWLVGTNGRDRNNWCSGFEKVMAAFGLDESVVRPRFSNEDRFRSHMVMSAVMAKSRDGRWGIWKRSPSRWRQVAGTEGITATGTGTLLYSGDGPLRIPLTPMLAIVLPDGSRLNNEFFKESRNGTTMWVPISENSEAYTTGKLGSLSNYFVTQIG